MICITCKNTITISDRFHVLAFTNNEKQGELMVRFLYQIGTHTVIKDVRVHAPIT